MRWMPLSLFFAAVLLADGKDPFEEDSVGEGWIHEDIEAGYKQARATGKPLLVAFR